MLSLPNPFAVDSPDESLRCLDQKNDIVRTTISVSRKVMARLHGIYPRDGVVQNTVNILLAKLYHELTNAGITSYDPAAYIIALDQCSIVLGGTHAVITSQSKPGTAEPVADSELGLAATAAVEPPLPKPTSTNNKRTRAKRGQ